MKDDYPSFPTKNGWWGDHLHLKCCAKLTPFQQKRRFSIDTIDRSMFNRISIIAPQL